ncbi:MAG: hypothetical protein CSA13_02410 [Clostridiales bacterium]|nr:MAG: hypothetical protein CSA13_02410 [Clostridiales bacterium]
MPDPDYKLIKDKDYTLTYKDNINIGTATVTITGIGNYCSDTTKQFEITDKKVPILAANDLTKNYDGKVITLSDITGKSAKDGSADVAGTWHFVDGGSLVDTLDISRL